MANAGSPLRILSNQLAPGTGNAYTGSYWATPTYTGDVEHYVSNTGIIGSNYVGIWLVVDGADSTPSGYKIGWSSNAMTTYRMDNGVETSVPWGSAYNHGSDPNGFGIERVGGTINSYSLTGSTWTQRHSAADSTYTGAVQFGFDIYDPGSDNVLLDNEGGGSMAPPPATAEGQMGWGTMGAGNMGPNFGSGTTETPIAGSETHTTNEVASIAIAGDIVDSATQSEPAAAMANALAAAETHTFTEGTTSLAIALAGSETHTFTEGTTGLNVALVAVDAFTTTELVGILTTLGVTDSWALTDASSASQLLSLSASDSSTFTDAADVTMQQVLAASDSWVVVESAALSAALAANESYTQSEGTSTIAAALAATETHTLAESVSMANALAATDSASQTEAVALAIALAATDTGALSDLVTLLSAALAAADSATTTEAAETLSYDAIVAADSWAMNDVSSLLSTDAKSGSDLTNLTEALSIAAALVASETVTLTDLVTVLSAAMNVVDSSAMSEAAADLFQYTGVTATEAVALTEAASMASAMNVSDSLALTEEGPGDDIQIVDFTTNVTTNGMTIVMTRPTTNVAPGDLLVACISARGGVTPLPIVAPAGWALATSVRRGTAGWLAVYTRPAATNDPASWTFTGLSTVNFTHAGGMVALRSVSGTPIEASDVLSPGGTSVITVPNVTTTSIRPMLLRWATMAVASGASNDIAWSGATEVWEAVSTGASGTTRLAMASSPGPIPPGVTSDVTASGTFSTWASLVIAFAPLVDVKVLATANSDDSTTFDEATDKVEGWFVEAMETHNLTELAAETLQQNMLTATDASALTEVSASIANALLRSDSFTFTEFADQSTPAGGYIHSLPPLSGILDEAVLDGFVESFTAAGDVTAAEAFGAVANAVATALLASAVANGQPVDATAEGLPEAYLGTIQNGDLTTHGNIYDGLAGGLADYTGAGAITDAEADGTILDQQSTADVTGATSEGDPLDNLAGGDSTDEVTGGVEV